MTAFGVLERPYATPVQNELSRVPAGVTAQTCQLFDITTAFTTVTATIYAASIVLPRNLPIVNLGCLVTTAGTVTGFWQGLIDAGLAVRSVTANTAAPSTGFFNQAATGGYVTPYAGLYYYILGTVSSVAAQVAATSPAPSAASFAGPPVYQGTSATAATTTPPALGTVLGALTGTVGGLLYGQTS